MLSSDNLGRAYPFVFNPTVPLPPDSAIADIDIIVYSSKFEPALHPIVVTSISLTKLTLVVSAITNETITCSIEDGIWVVTSNQLLKIRVLAGRREARQQLWTGQAVIEPARIVVIPGANQSIEVYNKTRTRMPALAGCLDYAFADEEQPMYVKQCDITTGEVVLAGGFSSRVFQYDASRELTVFGDPEGGEAGKPCTGQMPLYSTDIAPAGRNTLDGAPRCSDVVRSINGISVDNFQFEAGTGVTVFAQPNKSRGTVRLDGAGSAICPFPEIQRAPCPPGPDYPCGPIVPTDYCPDEPGDLASLRVKGTIPPIDSLPIIAPRGNTKNFTDKCKNLPEHLSFLTQRGCVPATAVYDSQGWRFTKRCRPACSTNLPTDNAKIGDERTIPCEYSPPDTTIGVRNNLFTDFKFWGITGSPDILQSHVQLTSADLPAVRISTGEAVYQTQISVGHDSVLSFRFMGELRLSIVVLGKLCVDVLLNSPSGPSDYVSDFVVPANREVAIHFSVEVGNKYAIVSMPFLAAIESS